MRSQCKYLVCLFFAFISCHQESVLQEINELENSEILSDLDVREGRLRFSSLDSFMKNYNIINEMNPEEINCWLDGMNYSSLYDVCEPEDESIKESSTAFIVFLNENYEFCIDDMLIWYYKNAFYLLNPEDTEEQKKNPSLLEIYGKSEVERLDDPVTKGLIGSNAISKSYQLEFRCNINPNVRFKYVNEIRSHRYSMGAIEGSDLFLDLKMEWKKSAGWKEAGEPRFISFSIAGTADATLANGYYPYSVNKWAHFNDVTKNQSVLLARHTGYTTGWNLRLTANISQNIIGYSTSQWVNQGITF